MEFRTPSASLRTSWPATRAEPSVGGVSVVSMRIKRGLARAVRPQQAEEFALLHGET